MPALSQSSLVRAWLKLSATSDSRIGCAIWGSGIASAVLDAAPQTLAPSFQVMPALSQSSLVRAWLKLSATSDSRIGCAIWGSGIVSAAWDAAPQTLAPSFQGMPALSQ